MKAEELLEVQNQKVIALFIEPKTQRQPSKYGRLASLCFFGFKYRS